MTLLFSCHQFISVPEQKILAISVSSNVLKINKMENKANNEIRILVILVNYIAGKGTLRKREF